MQYASLWRRWVAYLIDALVIFGVLLVLMVATAHSKPLYLVANALGGVFYTLYTFAMHLRYGQTVGKWAMGAKVVCVGGKDLTLKASALRSTPILIISCAWVAATLIALSPIPAEMYLGPRNEAFSQLEAEARPSWYESIYYALSLLFLLDLAWALASRQKQTFHDYCGGTVVIRAQRR